MLNGRTRAAVLPGSLPHHPCTRRFRSDRYVVQLREVLASKSKVFIVLELITGGELFNKLVTEGRCVGVCGCIRESVCVVTDVRCLG